MKRKHDIDSLMLASIYEETSPEEEKELQTILREDSTRMLEYQELKQTTGLISGSVSPQDPGEEFWNSVVDRFQEAAFAEEDADSRKEPTQSAWFLFWKPALQIGIIATVLIFGIFIGKQFSASPVHNPMAENSTETTQPLASDDSSLVVQDVSDQRNLYMRNVARDSLVRSNRVLGDFMRINSGEISGQQMKPWPTARIQEIEDILNTIAILRNDSGSESISQIDPLLDELELVMNEIVSIRNTSREDLQFEIQFLQNGIERRNILQRLERITTGIR